MVLFSDSDLQELRDILTEFTDDTSINTVLKYRQFTDQDYYDPTEQSIKSVYTDWADINAISSDLTKEEVEYIGGMFIGDKKFTIDRSGVSGELSIKDVVVNSGVTYNVLKTREDPLNISATIFARKVSEAL